MDVTMQLVAKYCGNELMKYSECVEKHPHSWPSTCDMLRLAVAKCSDQNHTIKRVKVECVKEFDKYNSCIRGNPTSVERCIPLLDHFSSCAERVLGNEEKQKTDKT
ncbi:coiled-coil-helix-coiled-coil-helix domain-containing protein 5-like [Lineus longissimus]|uniref:coiled-coil-helix-coiled-coil-helix domain-containing protein 5-like n=1 Tax=Lineus longissimus TaxID=88925 RepID=UPI002B4E87CF